MLTAVSMPSQHYLGSAIVDTKTNEIPVACALFKKLDLDGRKVSLDALHTQDQSARELVLEHGADFLLTIKGNQSTVQENIQNLVPPPPAIFFQEDLTPTLAGTREFNKNQFETRTLRSCPASPEQVDFLCVEQVGLLRRTLRQHRPETVALVTSCRPEELDATQWLKDNRAAWGIESGLHQRLDVSHLDDQCRIRKPISTRVAGMFRRFSNSLAMHWRSLQKKPEHKITTDFFTAMNAEHHRHAFCCLHAHHPSFKTIS